jgi:hypothetical protein
MAELFFYKNLQYWPTTWLEEFKVQYMDPYPKTAGCRVVRRYGLTVLFLIFILISMMACV